MKKVLFIFGVIIGVMVLYYLLIIGTNNSCILVPSTRKIDNSELNFYVKEESIINNKATFVLENNSNNTYSYGYPYELEKNINSIWYIVLPKEDLAFILPAFHLSPKDKKEFEVDFKEYGNLTKGKYRLVKDIDLMKIVDEEDSPEFTTYYMAAEFIIN